MISNLRLQHFRSYEDASFEFNTGVTIIVGPNASGKTNLLEAILVLARGKSYRVKDSELVAFKKPWTRIDGRIDSMTTRTVKITVNPELGKQYEIDGKMVRRLSLQQTLPVVLFEPNHLQLFNGGSERRRDYLDNLLEQTTSGYGTALRQYRRALTQRNTLLKQGLAIPHAQLFPWDIRLSQLAGVLVRARNGLISRINKELAELYKQLSNTGTEVIAEYTNRWPVESYESQFLKRLESGLADDRLRGFTSSGPHREDVHVLFNGRPAQDVASRGETRTVVLALKIIELKVIEAVRDTTPLLLLDDVFSELDSKRRSTLANYLAPYQTFITTTDADAITGQFAQESEILKLR